MRRSNFNNKREKKIERFEKTKKKAAQTQGSASAVLSDESEDNDKSEVEFDLTSDDEFDPESSRSTPRPKSATLEIPTKTLSKDTGLSADATNLSIRSHTIMQAASIVWRSILLGSCQAFGITVTSYCSTNYLSLGWYISVMSFFHFSEFVVTSVIRPQNLTSESFLLNHSKAYGIAALVSWVEYWTELWLFPGLKKSYWISGIGLFLCIGGEIVRKTAMLTAFHNFDHLIRTQREEHHQLVTGGIYSLCRHPSYVGWFYWSIGTQIMLCNPLCSVAYLIASWKFFNERVFEEEVTLLNFFGKEYVAYQSKVPTGLPFIHGYNIN
uniref:Protein-S-isoprenylcysteine O-methyltransferase n=1 Tax=Daphnia magna TaxID=35525 RepID=A0A4Y7MQK8_9CRUS|nr:EOG090X0CFU [Daphnia magna]SVE83288.1 EOG090X0CFU [Daphnia magna]